MSASELGSGILSVVTPAGKVIGTGVLPAIQNFKLKFGDYIDPSIVNEVKEQLSGLFGGFPNSDDIAPAALFTAIFSVFTVAYFYIFIRDYKNGHRFWAFFGLGFYSILRLLGFALRIKWSSDVMQIQLAAATMVFSSISVLFLNMLNMLFGHRIFTWRHPETGNSRWFKGCMIIVYLLIFALVVMSILGQGIPYLYFLTPANYKACHDVEKVVGVVQTLYAFAGIFLIAIAYAIPPGRIGTLHYQLRNRNQGVRPLGLPKTFSATWIKSTSMFYFPNRQDALDNTHKGEAAYIVEENELSSGLRNEAEKQVNGSEDTNGKMKSSKGYIRVMPSDREPACGLVSHNDDVNPNGPKIPTAIILILCTSSLLCISNAVRCVSVFIISQRAHAGGAAIAGHSSWVLKSWVLYLFYGVFEVIINTLLLVFRADLRFYIPDHGVNIQMSGNSGDSIVEEDGRVDQEAGGVIERFEMKDRQGGGNDHSVVVAVEYGKSEI